MQVLKILTSSGETVLEWNRADAQSVEDVRREFNSLIKSGFQAFRIDSPTTGELIRKFQPKAQEIIMTAPMMGG